MEADVRYRTLPGLLEFTPGLRQIRAFTNPQFHPACFGAPSVDGTWLVNSTTHMWGSQWLDSLAGDFVHEQLEEAGLHRMQQRNYNQQAPSHGCPARLDGPMPEIDQLGPFPFVLPRAGRHLVGATSCCEALEFNN
jgi:hypothetical protein